MISKFFIDRPVFASVLSIVIVLAGLVAMRVLPISQYPQIVPPEVVAPVWKSKNCTFAPSRMRGREGKALRKSTLV